MFKKIKKNILEMIQDEPKNNDSTTATPESENPAEVSNTTETTEQQETELLEKLQEENAALKDKCLRLYAEFDNYKRRSAKERVEWLQNASQEVIQQLLPVLDDFERAFKAEGVQIETTTASEGFALIYHKLSRILEQRGLKKMHAVGEVFDPELHAAITEVPIPDDSLKGKVIDVVEEGYWLNDKIIRFAQVVVGK